MSPHRTMRGLIAVTAVVVVALAGAGATAAKPDPGTSPATSTPTTTTPAAAPGSGVSVGTPSTTSTTSSGGSSSGGAVDAGGADHPGFFDIPGKVRKAIDDWFSSLVKDAISPAMKVLGQTALSTVQPAGQPRLVAIWQITVGIADGLLVLVVIVAAAVAMGHETVQTRYALKDVAPRLLVTAIAVNASLGIADQLISMANALASGLLAGTNGAEVAATELERFISGAVTDGGIALTLLGLVCAVMALVLLVLYVVRAALVVLLIAAGPLMLLGHALPQTEGLARLWWKALAGTLAVQLAQALTLGVAVQVFFASDGRAALGLDSSGGMIDLLVAICVLWLLIKIPLWIKDLVIQTRPSIVTSAARAYVTGRVRGAMA
jgi:hypothetical protein